jgi:hypothetical protein
VRVDVLQGNACGVVDVGGFVGGVVWWGFFGGVLGSRMKGGAQQTGPHFVALLLADLRVQINVVARCHECDIAVDRHGWRSAAVWFKPFPKTSNGCKKLHEIREV